MKLFPPLATDHPRILRPLGQARDRVPGASLNLVHVHSSFDEEGGDFSVTLTGDYWMTPDSPPGRGDRRPPRRPLCGGGRGDHRWRAARTCLQPDRHVPDRWHLRRGPEGRDLPRSPVRRR